ARRRDPDPERPGRARVGGAPMTRGEVDYADVQGLVRFGYKRMTEAAYLLVRVKDAAAARAWLRTTPVTTAAPLDPPPTTALQVAFTAPGLKTLGVAESALAGFSSEFVAGMTPDARARRLGDVGANASSQWDWGGTSAVPHLAVMLFAEPGGLARLEQRTTGG